MDRVMTVLMILSISIIVMVLHSVRREHIRVEYSVSWLSSAVLLLVLSLNPGAVVWLAQTLGVASPAIAILMTVFFVFLFVGFRFSLRVSALKDANIALAQRVAILKFHIKSAHEQQKTANG
jgi:hypothetical protein